MDSPGSPWRERFQRQMAVACGRVERGRNRETELRKTFSRRLTSWRAERRQGTGALLFPRLEGPGHDLLFRGEKWSDLSLKKNHSSSSVAMGLEGGELWEARKLGRGPV